MVKCTRLLIESLTDFVSSNLTHLIWGYGVMDSLTVSKTEGVGSIPAYPIMDDREVAISWIKECEVYKNNIVYNNCPVCKKIFIQKWPHQMCPECGEMQNVF